MAGDKPRVLCVDDEEDVLRGLKANLRKEFAVQTATSGAAGLELLEAEPFAVVVSDMRMPQMNGAQFLAQARARCPDTVRILLTGQSDIDSAIAAINEGQIFRFLTKPCDTKTLASVLAEAVEQNRLLRLEHDLLERTLRGAVDGFAEILSLVSPAAFSRSSQVAKIARHVASTLGVAELWRFEIASLLSQIGCVTVPNDVVEKAYASEPLGVDEQRAFDRHPEVAAKLLAGIPRLEEVAEMVRGQNAEPAADDREPVEREAGALGAQILRGSLHLARLLESGEPPPAAAAELRSGKLGFEDWLLDALADFPFEREGLAPRSVGVDELRIGMILRADVLAESDLLLAKKGAEINTMLLERLRNFANGVGVRQPIEVLAPSR